MSDTVVDTSKFSEETIWQAICLITRLANSNPKGIATIMECRRAAIELNERMKVEREIT